MTRGLVRPGGFDMLKINHPSKHRENHAALGSVSYQRIRRTEPDPEGHLRQQRIRGKSTETFSQCKIAVYHPPPEIRDSDQDLLEEGSS